jgi:histidine triad (HIT) family protein
MVPRRHVEDMFAAEDEDLTATLHLAREVASALRDVAGAEGVNVLHASGAAAEQSVFHLHFHLVPRWSDDDLTTWPTGRSARSGDTVPEEQLRLALASRVCGQLLRQDNGRSRHQRAADTHSSYCGTLRPLTA